MTRSSRFFSSLRGAGVLLLAGCGVGAAREDQPPARATGQPVDREFILAAGRSAEVRGTDLTITFRSVEQDDRCPLDVQCVQAGEARAAFAVARSGGGGGGDTTVVLGTRPGTETAAVGAWRIELRSLAPAPTAGAPTPPERYEATLEVSRE